ncbi:MAG: LacI family transcriptional regulator [Alphaproteobacteria bacterium]|nr:LacI family transcriptional regulator [Alphaproteobacteria bacterium]
MANIFDVAKQAGVSVKTVSRVMNEADKVRKSTRERVEAVMAELNYNPSHAARELRSARSRSIGMLFGDPGSGFQARFHHAALSACDKAGYFLAAGLFDETSPDWERQLTAFLARTRVKNMILVPPLSGADALHRRLEAEGISYVLVSPSHNDGQAPSVGMDDFAAAYEVTRHLLDLGHRRIGHISGALDHISSKQRQEGFVAALREEGSELIRPDWVRCGMFVFAHALKAADDLLVPEDRPTAIFASNDEMAAAVYFTANRLGLRVPQDLSVVGFDDVAIATTIWPTLTTIAQPYEAMSEAAVQQLAALDSGAELPESGRVITLDYEFKLRNSTSPPVTV